jgi:GNAT superfamily N-acetyltransferase
MYIADLADHPAVIPTLAQWFHAEWSYLYPERTGADVERQIAERAQKTAIPLALVALGDDQPVGTVCLKVHDMDTRTDLTPWLAGLYVAAPWRRRGVGAALVAAIEARASELHVPTLYLYTPQSAAFYARLGWRVLEQTEYHGYPVTVMTKTMRLRPVR